MGGGTPSLLSPSQFGKIVAAVRDNFDTSGLEEFTVEVNPDDICSKGGGELVQAFIDNGVNRVSVGVQSFCDSHLKWMNRRHDAAEAVRALELLLAKFDNVSLDLIFGFGMLTWEQWLCNLQQAVASGVQHISAYQMSLDGGSMLSDLAAKGKYAEPDEEICRAQYTMLQDVLDSAGFVQYEISNFCRDGKFSRHNTGYWSREPYLGLGPGAHSFDGDRRRSWNVEDLGKYLSGAAREGETLSDQDIYNEKVMLGLRTSAGVEAGLLEGSDVHNLSYDSASGRYSIARSDMFISDAIILDYLKS